MQITTDQLQRHIDRGVTIYSADASELRLPVGRFPPTITVPGLGNGQHFVLRKVHMHDGDTTCVEYSQLLGCIDLHIFND